MAIRFRSFVFPVLFAALTACGGGGGVDNGGGGNPPPAADTTPDAYSFVAAEGYFPGTVLTSDPTTISGINSAASVSVSGGEYAIGNGDFTTSAGSISNGQQVKLRGITGTVPGGSTTVTLTVGGVEGSFRIVTTSVQTPADTSPAQFTLPAPTSATPGTTITSAPVVVEEINAASPVSVSGGEYRINGGEWTSEPGLVNPGDAVEVRGTVPETTNSVAGVILTIGDVSENFSIATAPAAGEPDTVPDPVNVSDVASSVNDPHSVATGESVIFGPVVIAGIDSGTSVESNTEISLDGGATWISPHTEGQMVTNGMSVLVRVRAAEFPETRAEAHLNVGGRTTIFAVTTAPATPGNDDSPDPVSLLNPIVTAPGEAVIFPAVTVSGIDRATTVSLSADAGVTAEFRINGGVWLPAGTEVGVTAGQYIEVRVTTGESGDANLNIGDLIIRFPVTVDNGENSAPVIEPLGNVSMDEGSTRTFTPTVSDPDGDALTYAWTVPDGFVVEGTDTSELVISQAPLVASQTTYQFQFTATDIYLASATRSFNVTVRNIAPTADAGPDKTVAEGAHIILDGSNSVDPGGVITSYAWAKYSGPDLALGDTGSAQLEFDSPELATDTTWEFRLVVTNADNMTDDDIVRVTILADNLPPEITGINAPATVAESQTDIGISVTATDPDNEALTYAWTQISGSPATWQGGQNSPNAVLTAPMVDGDETIRLQVTVTDGAAQSDTATVDILVENGNAAPTVTINGPATVNEGDSVTLTANATDADGDDLTYSWSQSQGTDAGVGGSATNTVTFTAPSVDANELMRFTVTVDDGNGGSRSVNHDIQLSNVPVTTPDAFSFAAVTGAEPSSTVESAAAQITGIETAVTATATGGEIAVSDGTSGFSAYAASVTVQPNHYIKLRVTASTAFSSTVTATADINGVDAGFDVTTKADTAPTVSIDFPTPNTLTTDANQTHVLVRGRADDNDGIVSITVNGDPATFDETDGSRWHADAAISSGSNTITVTVTDTGGNSVSQSVNVIRALGPDIQMGDVVYEPNSNSLIGVDNFLDRELQKVDLSTGVRSEFSSASVGDGPFWGQWTCDILGIDPARHAVMVACQQGNGVLYAVDLGTGDRSVIADSAGYHGTVIGSGAPFTCPAGTLDLARNRALIADCNSYQLLAVDLDSGIATIVLTGLNEPWNSQPVVVDNAVYLGDWKADWSGYDIKRIAPLDGSAPMAASILATLDDDTPNNIYGLENDAANNRLLVLPSFDGRITAVALTDGSQTTISEYGVAGNGPALDSAQAMALDVVNNPAQPRLLVATKDILAVSIGTGDRSVVSAGNRIGDSSFNMRGIAYDPEYERAFVATYGNELREIWLDDGTVRPLAKGNDGGPGEAFGNLRSNVAFNPYCEADPRVLMLDYDSQKLLYLYPDEPAVIPQRHLLADLSAYGARRLSNVALEDGSLLVSGSAAELLHIACDGSVTVVSDSGDGIGTGDAIPDPVAVLPDATDSGNSALVLGRDKKLYRVTLDSGDRALARTLAETYGAVTYGNCGANDGADSTCWLASASNGDIISSRTVKHVTRFDAATYELVSGTNPDSGAVNGRGGVFGPNLRGLWLDEARTRLFIVEERILHVVDEETGDRLVILKQ